MSLEQQIQSMQMAMQQLEQQMTSLEKEASNATSGQGGLMPNGSGSAPACGTPATPSASSSGTPAVTGNLQNDLKTLLAMVGGNGTNASQLQQFAFAVGHEAYAQGDTKAMNTANDIGGSLSDGSYSKQGSMSALSATLSGQSIDPLQNNLADLRTALQGGESSQSVSNDMYAIINELGGSNPALTNMLKSLASGVANGSVSDQNALAQLNFVLPGPSSLQTTGNLNADTQTLMQLVNGDGTNPETLLQYAQQVQKEASTQGDQNTASAAGNIANSLTDGTYSQQGSLNALANALTGDGTDALQNNLKSIALQFQTGQDKGSIANNLQALANEVGSGSANGQIYNALASGLRNGQLSSAQAQAVYNMTASFQTGQTAGSMASNLDALAGQFGGSNAGKIFQNLSQSLKSGQLSPSDAQQAFTSVGLATVEQNSSNTSRSSVAQSTLSCMLDNMTLMSQLRQNSGARI